MRLFIARVRHVKYSHPTAEQIRYFFWRCREIFPTRELMERKTTTVVGCAGHRSRKLNWINITTIIGVSWRKRGGNGKTKKKKNPKRRRRRRREKSLYSPMTTERMNSCRCSRPSYDNNNNKIIFHMCDRQKKK